MLDDEELAKIGHIIKVCHVDKDEKYTSVTPKTVEWMAITLRSLNDDLYDLKREMENVRKRAIKK